jgi:predicted NUDIX family phosphoesterase
VTDKAAERVLVVPTEVFHQAGVFQGFCPRVADYLPQLLDPRHLAYRPRAEMEIDPNYKQIIPYVVLRWQYQVFHYTRGKRTTETRLQALRSVGVGGHINAGDRSLFSDPYREAMLREVHEEILLETAFTERCIGLINVDSNPVGTSASRHRPRLRPGRAERPPARTGTDPLWLRAVSGTTHAAGRVRDVVAVCAGCARLRTRCLS